MRLNGNGGLFLCLLVISLTASNGRRNVRYVAFDPPVVHPQEDYVTVEARSEYTLTCDGSRPIHWSISRSSVKKNWAAIENRMNVTYTINDTGDRRYSATLVVRDMVYSDTGSYICSYNDTQDTSNVEDNTNIYVYVYDQVHLLTLDGFDFQQFVQYDTAVLPCTTTHPNVNVQLFYEDKEVLPDNTFVTFNPKIGFMISPVVPKHTGMYKCSASYQGRTSEYVISLSVRPKTSYVPPPMIHKTSGDHVTVGQTMNLTCTITVEWSIQVKLTWNVPNMDAKNPRLYIPTPISRNATIGGKALKVVEQMMTLSRVMKEDQGYYECIVTDHSSNTRRKREFIRIYQADQSYLRVFHDGTKTVHKSAGRDESVQWVVHVASHPPANIQWHDQDGRPISVGEDKHNSRMVKTFVKGSSLQSVLQIKDLKLTDAGQYSVRVDNGPTGGEVKWENFTLIVSGGPQVSLNLVGAGGAVVDTQHGGVAGDLYEYGGQYTLRCVARGYPTPQIDWTFVACSDYGVCEQRPKHLVAITEKANGKFQRDSTLSVVASESGRYSCIATSGENAQSASVNFFLTDQKDGFAVDGPPNNLALEGDMVELRCAVSKYNYTLNSVIWYRQTVKGLCEVGAGGRHCGVDPSGVEVFRDDKTSRFSIVKGLRFRAVAPKDAGVYVCKAEPRDSSLTDMANGNKRSREVYSSRRQYLHHSAQDNDKMREQQLELKVELYTPPVIYDTVNMHGNESYVFAKGEGIELGCRVRGTLMPNVVWRKDGVRVNLTSGNMILLDDSQTLRIGVVVEDRDEGTYSCEASNKKATVKQWQKVIKVESPTIFQTNLLGGQVPVASDSTEKEGSSNPRQQENKKIILAGNSMTLKCAVTGKPQPTVTWTLDGQPLLPLPESVVKGAGETENPMENNDPTLNSIAARLSASVNLTEGNQTLFIRRIDPDLHSGQYACFAANIGGTASQTQLVAVDSSGGSLLATVYASGITLPVSIAVGVSILVALILLVVTRTCCCCCPHSRHGGRTGPPCGRKWKAPPTPPTPRLTQFDMPEEEHGTESCRLTLSRDGSPACNITNGMMIPAGGGVPPLCHGCSGCSGTCHSCSATCHYGGSGIYGCTPAAGANFYGSSILGVRPGSASCTMSNGGPPSVSGIGDEYTTATENGNSRHNSTSGMMMSSSMYSSNNGSAPNPAQGGVYGSYMGNLNGGICGAPSNGTLRRNNGGYNGGVAMCGGPHLQLPPHQNGGQTYGQEFSMYGQNTLPVRRYNAQQAHNSDPLDMDAERRSASPRLNAEF